MNSMNPKFSYVVPVLHVSNLDQACAFFEVIGFERQWSWGEPACYAGMYSATDHIIHLHKREIVAPGSAGLYLQIEGVDDVHAACQAAGLTFGAPLTTQAYGMRDFSLIGPDGIEITFGEELES